ncbi:MAG: glucose-6-phosphate isomerase family protein [Ilumatobacteraceae bacterium]
MTWTHDMKSQRLVVDAATGGLEGATGSYEKRLADLDGLYLDADAFAQRAAIDADTIVYRVHDLRPTDRAGDMIVGTSALEPGTIGAEYYMTRGHLHAISDRPEVYHCVHGHGVMLMEDSEGNSDAIDMTPGVVAYVAPGWIHRSVNVGPERFVTVFSYPADAGQDYAVIEKAGGMASLVVTDGDGGWKLIENERYVGR